MSTTAQQAKNSATLVGMSLPLGATMLVVVAAFLTGDAAAPTPERAERARILTYAFVGMLALLSGTALFFWRTRVEPIIHDLENTQATQSVLMSNLMVVWALVEAVALFGGVLFLLHGTAWTGVTGVLLSWLVFLMTRPQLEWFERLPAE